MAFTGLHGAASLGGCVAPWKEHWAWFWRTYMCIRASFLQAVGLSVNHLLIELLIAPLQNNSNNTVYAYLTQLLSQPNSPHL